MGGGGGAGGWYELRWASLSFDTDEGPSAGQAARNWRVHHEVLENQETSRHIERSHLSHKPATKE